MVRDHAEPVRRRPRTAGHLRAVSLPARIRRTAQRTERRHQEGRRDRRQFRPLLQGWRQGTEPGQWIRARGGLVRDEAGVATPSQRHRSRYRRGKAARRGAENAGEPPALDPRHGAGRHDRDRRIWHHPVLQHRGRAAVRLCRAGGHRQERQRADADAGPAAPRQLSGALPVDRRAAHHRHRTDRDRQAQGRDDLSDAPVDRRDAVRRRALFHRLRARPHRAPADPGAAAGIAIRTGSRFAPERDGRDGLRARA